MTEAAMVSTAGTDDLTGASQQTGQLGISKAGPEGQGDYMEGTPQRVPTDASKAADDVGSGGLDADEDMQEQAGAEVLESEAHAAANSYMDVDGLPAQASFLTSPDSKEEPPAEDAASEPYPTVKVCCHSPRLWDIPSTASLAALRVECCRKTGQSGANAGKG